MSKLNGFVDIARAKWSVAGTVKRRWFVFALGCAVGFLVRSIL